MLVDSVLNSTGDPSTSERDDRKRIRKWLFSPDEVFNQAMFQISVQSNRTSSKTGAWFLDGPEYVHWSSTNNSFLWLCGKSK
jgi:hypothetical protein